MKQRGNEELTFQTSFEVRFEIMIQAPQIDGIEIDPTDWANTPAVFSRW
jgi:hypothetical protein